MLVLTRRKNEQVRINDDITIVVVAASRGKVRLGFDAPKGVTIVRGELVSPTDRDCNVPHAVCNGKICPNN